MQTHKKDYKSLTANNNSNFAIMAAIKSFLHQHYRFLLILLGLCLVVYFNSLNTAFVSDDLDSFVNNPTIRSVSGNLQKNGLNIQYLLHSIFYKFFGLSPLPHKLLAVILHSLVAMEVFILFYLLFGKNLATITSLLFAVHPINSEAVVWVSARSYLINALVVFAVLILYLAHSRTRSKKLLIIANVLFLLNVIFLQSPWVLILLPILIAFDLFYIKTPFKKLFLGMIPMFLIGVTFIALKMWPIFLNRLDIIEQSRPYGEKISPLITIPYSISNSLKLLVFPYNLTLFHEAELIQKGFIIGSSIGFFLLIIIFLLLMKHERKVAGALALIVVSILPALSPIQVSNFLAERYLYIGSAFFCFIVAIFLQKVQGRTRSKDLALSITIVLLFIYGIRTLARNSNWRSEEVFWRETAKMSPYSPSAYNNLGCVLIENAKYEEALEALKMAMQINPMHPDAYYNTGILFLIHRDYEAAENYLLKERELSPYSHRPIYTLGILEYKRQNHEKAREYFLHSLQLQPELFQAYEYLARVENELGNAQVADYYTNEALKLTAY